MSTPDANGSALAWFSGWLTIIVLLVLLAKSNWGKPIVYYTFILFTVILVLTHVDSFTGLLSGFNQGNTNAQNS